MSKIAAGRVQLLLARAFIVQNSSAHHWDLHTTDDTSVSKSITSVFLAVFEPKNTTTVIAYTV